MHLNYRHLYLFWLVAKEGGLSRAAEREGLAVQTVSEQVRALERSLGHQLLKPSGRGVVLTEAGRAACARAEEIFRIGQHIADEVRQAATEPVLRLAVGLTDGLSKLAVHALLAPVLGDARLRLLCHEGESAHLLGELALHRLDLVLAGHGAPATPGLGLGSERLLSSPIVWMGPPVWAEAAAGRPFPQCLDDLPLLLPTAHAALRLRLDAWFEQHGLRPHIVGEFEDSALLALFAERGLGVFPVSAAGAADLPRSHGLSSLGRCGDLHEEIHAIRARRGMHHPLVQRIVEAARTA